MQGSQLKIEPLSPSFTASARPARAATVCGLRRVHEGSTRAIWRKP